MGPSYDAYDYRLMNRLKIVPRWCVIPTLRRQNVAEHTFHVMVICDWLLKFHRDVTPEFSLEVMREALGHDRDEAITGDISAGSKPIPDAAKVATKSDAEIVLKVADYLECIAFLNEEIRLGNTTYPPSIIEDALDRMTPYWMAFPYDNRDGTLKPGPRELAAKADRLFFDPESVHPVFDVPF